MVWCSLVSLTLCCKWSPLGRWNNERVGEQSRWCNVRRKMASTPWCPILTEPQYWWHFVSRVPASPHAWGSAGVWVRSLGIRSSAAQGDSWQHSRAVLYVGTRSYFWRKKKAIVFSETHLTKDPYGVFFISLFSHPQVLKWWHRRRVPPSLSEDEVWVLVECARAWA